MLGEVWSRGRAPKKTKGIANLVGIKSLDIDILRGNSEANTFFNFLRRKLRLIKIV